MLSDKINRNSAPMEFDKFKVEPVHTPTKLGSDGLPISPPILQRNIADYRIIDAVKYSMVNNTPSYVARHHTGWFHLVEPKGTNKAIFHTVRLNVNPYNSEWKDLSSINKFLKELNSGKLVPKVHTKVVYKKV